MHKIETFREKKKFSLANDEKILIHSSLTRKLCGSEFLIIRSLQLKKLVKIDLVYHIARKSIFCL